MGESSFRKPYEPYANITNIFNEALKDLHCGACNEKDFERHWILDIELLACWSIVRAFRRSTDEV